MKKLKIWALLILLTFATATVAPAKVVDIRFAFTPSVSTDVAGYILYSRDVNGIYSQGDEWDVSDILECGSTECEFTLTDDLNYGDYVFGMKAYNEQMTYSDLSNETEVFTIERLQPKPAPPTGVRTLLRRIIAKFKHWMGWGKFRIRRG